MEVDIREAHGSTPVVSQHSTMPRKKVDAFLPTLAPYDQAVESMRSSSAELRGAIFTKREIVSFILDLSGYQPRIDLAAKRLLEPSVGHGEFIVEAADRVLLSAKKHGGIKARFEDLKRAITAIELHPESIAEATERLRPVFKAHGLTLKQQKVLISNWIREGDFLLVAIEGGYDFVVGNPPYVRQELVPDELIAEYRRRYATVYDRADLYIPFIERGLTLLGPRGKLVFICSDRWMKNKYGGPLRKLVSERFHLDAYVDMVSTPAFESDVIAYPAITVIGTEKKPCTHIAHQPQIETSTLSRLSRALAKSNNQSAGWSKIPPPTSGSDPWILEDSPELALIRRLEREFPSLEDAGCAVGIGVATGADQVFLGAYDTLPVEPNRKLPILLPRDIETGRIEWQGLGIVNPFEDNGSVVKLETYPELAAYFEVHKEAISARHVAKKSKRAWYRTIDKITTSLVGKPKLLIPDIKGKALVVYDEGKFYPHHNLYYIVSEKWDLRALQAVLTSGIAHLFVATYTTKMQGGYLRFQAQYLRRIHVPDWKQVSRLQRKQLIAAYETNDAKKKLAATAALLNLTSAERAILRKQGT